jgi:diguanylate cyclase (GGDEF)-like protein
MSESPPESPPEVQLPNRLLIVDDDPLIRLLARERLSTDGHEVCDAGSGEEAIELFAELRPDLILLDVEMPGLDGFDVCKAIREHTGGRHVPIVILTGRDDVHSIEHAYEAGATDFMSKPLSWTVLAHRIRYILRASESFLEIRSQQVRLDEVQQYARLGSWEVDLKTGLISMSSAFRTMLGVEGSVESLPVGEVLERVHPDDRPVIQKLTTGALSSRDGFNLEHRIQGGRGEERIVYSQARVCMGEQDECESLEGFTQDITELRETEEQVKLMAFTDGLTGLSNRTAFKLHLESALQRARRTSESVAVLYIDLDNFKRVNDTFGHTAGDALLKIVAEEMKKSVRDTDLIARTAGGIADVMISRLGGDEFTIMLEGLTDPSDAGMVARRLLESLSIPVDVEGHELRVMASIGIALTPDDGQNADSLLRNADLAMYHAKKLGRANFQFYRKALNSDALERLELEASLCHAIENDELDVHFQPKLDPTSGRITGCEALSRWNHPERGEILPEVFIPLAESCGLIAALGNNMLLKACKAVAGWQKLGRPDFTLAVNLSARQIQDPEIVGKIEKVFEETDFDPRFIEFEITESALIHNEEQVRAVLESFRGWGSRICLDDFGTCHSPLTNLKRYPIEVLKIDRSFVAGIGVSKKDEAITSAILAMAHSLDMRVVAEGIETEEQLDFLIEHHCEEIQGFIVSEPLSAEAFEAFLETREQQ